MGGEGRTAASCKCCGVRDPDLCDRCGERAESGSWETAPAFLHGSITLGASSQIFAKLLGEKGCASEDAFEFWRAGRESNPLIQDFTAQRIDLGWGNQGDYRMCRSCQHELLALVGRFFCFATPTQNNPEDSSQ